MVTVCKSTLLKIHSVRAEAKRSVADYFIKQNEKWEETRLEQGPSEVVHQWCRNDAAFFCHILRPNSFQKLRLNFLVASCRHISWWAFTNTNTTTYCHLMYPVIIITWDYPPVAQPCQVLTQRCGFPQQCLTQYPWLQHDGDAVPCILCCNQCVPFVSGN